MPTPCFLLRDTDQASLSLRRYAVERVCPLGRYHEAITLIGTAPTRYTPTRMLDTIHTPHSDPRWPVACACGERFADSDPWQTCQDPIYEAVDGRRFTTRLGDAPPGAMWNAPYYQDVWAGPDGLSLIVVLPDGRHWAIDTPSSSGGHWTRTGNAPHLTVTPSILTPGYHGWLQNGILSDDLDGRTYAQR
jgi:hypothetical protein